MVMIGLDMMVELSYRILHRAEELHDPTYYGPATDDLIHQVLLEYLMKSKFNKVWCGEMWVEKRVLESIA